MKSAAPCLKNRTPPLIHEDLPPHLETTAQFYFVVHAFMPLKQKGTKGNCRMRFLS